MSKKKGEEKGKGKEKTSKALGGLTVKELRELLRQFQADDSKTVDQVMEELKKHFEEKGIKEKLDDYFLLAAINPPEKAPAER